MYGRSHINVYFELNLAQYRRLRATSQICTFSTLPLLKTYVRTQRAYARRNNYATVEIHPDRFPPLSPVRFYFFPHPEKRLS